MNTNLHSLPRRLIELRIEHGDLDLDADVLVTGEKIAAVLARDITAEGGAEAAAAPSCDGAAVAAGARGSASASRLATRAWSAPRSMRLTGSSSFLPLSVVGITSTWWPWGRSRISCHWLARTEFSRGTVCALLRNRNVPGSWR